MTQEQIDEAYRQLAEYEKEVADHNNQIIESLGCGEDLGDALDFCNLSGKIEWCDKPKFKPLEVKEVFGKLTVTHINQWSVGLEGDSYEGYIYAKPKKHKK